MAELRSHAPAVAAQVEEQQQAHMTAAASSSAATPAMSSRRASGCCWRLLRYAPLAPLIISFALLVWALLAATTHTYTPAPSLVRRLIGLPAAAPASNTLLTADSLEYASPHRCAMSYFALSHKHETIARLTDTSRALLDGELRFGDAQAATGAAVQQRRASQRRRRAEFDEDEDDSAMLAAAAAEEMAAAAASAAPAVPSTVLSDSERAQRAEFASFRRLFLNSLPAHLSRNSTARYKVWQYVEGMRQPHVEKYARQPHPHAKAGSSAAGNVPAHNTLPRVPVVFLHGNGGNYHQMRSLASRLSAWASSDRGNLASTASAEERARFDTHLPDLNDYFALDMHEESGALSGRLLWQHAWFANEALTHILAGYTGDTRAVLVCHSMGGVLCRAMFSLRNFPLDAHGQGRVALIATLGTPHRAPVLLTDEEMKKMYFLVNDAPEAAHTAASNTSSFAHLREMIDPAQSLQVVYAEHSRKLLAAERRAAAEQRTLSADEEPVSPPILLSISGGDRDFQVEPFLSDLDGIYADERFVPHTLSVATHALNWAAPTLSSAGAAAAAGVAAFPQQQLNARTRVDSVDHQCLAWCSQLVDVLAESVRDVTRNVLSQRLGGERKGYREMYERQRKLWVPPAVPLLRAMAESPLTPAETAASSSSQLQWPVAADMSVVPLASRSAIVASGSEALVFVWVGRMSSVVMCPRAGASEGCLELVNSVQRVAPLSHPTQTLNSDAGLLSTFMLHVPLSQLPTTEADDVFELRLTDESAARAAFTQLQIKKKAARPARGFGMAYRAVDLPLSSTGEASLPNDGAVYRWTRPLVANMDLHLSFHVAPHISKRASLLTPPRLIAFFSATHASGLNDTSSSAASYVFPRNSFADQLFTFHSNSNASMVPALAQAQSVHFYRSGMEQMAQGVFLRVPSFVTAAEVKDGAEVAVADDVMHLMLVEQGFVSGLRSLFLQMPLLPQILMGVALLLFGAQHEHLRRRGVFPRPLQLLLLPSHPSGSKLTAFFLAPVWWIGIILAVAMHFMWHGLLVGRHILATPAADDVAAHAGLGPAALLSGWQILSHRSWERTDQGVILLEASVAILLLLEALVFSLLWIIRQVFRVVSWIVCRPFTAAASSVSDIPQQRFLSTVFNRGVTVLWGLLFAHCILFSICVACVCMSRFGGMSFIQDSLWFVAKEVTAWLSTACMMFRLREDHFYFGKDIAPTLFGLGVWIGEVHLVPLVLALTGAALLMHGATLPDASPRNANEKTRAQRDSSAAHKASTMSLMLLVVLLLCTPSFLASFRLHEPTLTKKHVPNSLVFSPPTAPRLYEPSIAAPPAFDAEGVTPAEGLVYLFPFSIQSLLPPLPLVSLLWVTLLSWCALHVPFSPPVLQSACLSAYGVCLLLVSGVGSASALAHMHWLVIMLALCMLPHALASALYAMHLLLERIDGLPPGSYEQQMQREREQWGQQQLQAPMRTAAATLAGAAKKNK